jgi:HEAT repeat protein
VVFIFGLGIWNHFREPFYGDKSLSEWIDLLDSSVDPENPNDPIVIEARTAVRHIGTNAIPFLLRWIQARDSRLKLQLEEWTQNQNLVKIHFRPAVEKQIRGSAGFFLLGEVATPAISELEDQIFAARGSSGNESMYAFAALGFIGKDSLPFLTNCLVGEPRFIFGALEALARMGTNAEPALDLLVGLLQTNDANFKYNLIMPLSIIGCNKPEVVVPALIPQIQNTNGMVWLAALNALGQLGTNATAAIPQLLDALNNPRRCGRAALTLASVAGTNSAVDIVLNKIKRTSDSTVKIRLIGILPEWKNFSVPLRPAILTFAEDNDREVRRAAFDAAIDSGASIETISPILLKEEAAEPSRFSMTVLSALEKSGTAAKPLVPMLIKHVRILNQNNGKFPGEVARYPNSISWPFDFRTCDEFNALRRIDPTAADALEKELDNPNRDR